MVQNRNMSKAFIGQPAPGFVADAVVDGDYKTVSLKDYRGQYVVLFFYPLDFTFVCPTEIIAFSDRHEEFKKLGVTVLAASTDSKHSHLEWILKPRKHGGLGDMNIPLLADTSHKISRDYGVLKEDDGIAYRGLFVIDSKGILRQITINDLPVVRSVDETLRLVQAFQFVEKYGETCPTNWLVSREAPNSDSDRSHRTKRSKITRSQTRNNRKTTVFDVIMDNLNEVDVYGSTFPRSFEYAYPQSYEY